MDQIFSTRDCIVRGEFIYYYVADIGWIVRMEKNTGRLQYVPIQGYGRTFQADCCTCVRNSLYFLSIDGTCLLEYELGIGKFHIYDIDCGGKQDGNFIAVFSMENNVYIFTRYIKQVMIFDCVSKSISICQYPQPLLDVTFQSACLQNRKAWLFSDEGKAAFFDLQTHQWDYFNMEMEILNLVHSVVGQKMIYLLSREGNVYAWNTEKREVSTCTIKSNTKKNKSYVRMVLVAQNRCVLLPSIGNYIEMYDLNTGRLVYKENITDGRKRIEGREHWSAFRGYGEDTEWYYFISHAYKEHLIISKNTGEWYWCTSQYPSEAEWIKCRTDSGESVFYERWDHAVAFFDSLQNKDIRIKELEVGKKIWGFCSNT